ncbi:DUF4162 domain-containing protein, partial [bacterium]|nr:DUF4162 domain-containing protein [bacterium]
RSRAELWQAIEALAGAGTAIVLTTQYLEEADRLADEIVMIDRGIAVASGTPGQLKKDLEQEVLEIHVDGPEAVARAVAVIGETREVAADPGQRLVRVKADQGARGSLATLRMLEDAGIEIADFQLRSPTLDDVFLTLTDPNAVQVPR